MNLPIKKKKTINEVNMANKGMNLEQMVNDSNEYYLAYEKAVIHKKPIPIQIVHVKYPSRNKALIDEAYYRTPSTTDYNGVYNGFYIDFDCKECNNKTSFPIKNVHDHQVTHLLNCKKQKGISFLLIYFIKHNRYFILPIENFIPYYLDSKNGGRQSIPYEDFKNIAIEIFDGYRPRLDYLKGIDEYISKNNL